MRRLQSRQSATYEALLDRDVADGTALSSVLSALRSPDRPEELAGLDAALSAYFRSGPTAPRAPIAVRPATTRTVAGRLIALKAVTAVGGVTVIGGVALAATVVAEHHAPPAHHRPLTSVSSSAGQQSGGYPPAGSGPSQPATQRGKTVPVTVKVSGKPSAAHPAHPSQATQPSQSGAGHHHGRHTPRGHNPTAP